MNTHPASFSPVFLQSLIQEAPPEVLLVVLLAPFVGTEKHKTITKNQQENENKW